MTNLQRRAMELSDAISSLIQDYADEIHWQHLKLYKETALIEIPWNYDDAIPVDRGYTFDSISQRKKSAFRAIIKQINFINIFFKMGDFTSRELRLPWCKSLVILYIDAISILLQSLTKESRLEGQMGLYRLSYEVTEELSVAFDKVLYAQNKSTVLFKQEGKLSELGMRDVKYCEYALRELVKIHGPAIE